MYQELYPQNNMYQNDMYHNLNYNNNFNQSYYHQTGMNNYSHGFTDYNNYNQTYTPLTSPIGQTSNSHFSYVDQNGHNPGWHVTTPISGLGKNEGFENGYSHHDYLNDFNF